MESNDHKEHRFPEYEVSICEKKDGCARELDPPEEVEFAVGGDEVLEEDEYCDEAAIISVPCMRVMRLATNRTRRG